MKQKKKMTIKIRRNNFSFVAIFGKKKIEKSKTSVTPERIYKCSLYEKRDKKKIDMN